MTNNSNCSKHSSQNEHKSRMFWVREGFLLTAADMFIELLPILCERAKPLDADVQALIQRGPDVVVCG